MQGLPAGVEACLFDLDGVLTQTAALHEIAWGELFDGYLRTLPGNHPPFSHDDYLEYVDGRKRLDGVRTFLVSRGITLPEGDVADEPAAATISGLGNQKRMLFEDLISSRGVDVYPGSIDFVKLVRAQGSATAVVGASRNCEAILESAGIADLFDARIDGVIAEARAIPGKPAPDMFLAGARAIGKEPATCAVFEDALAGVAAGRAGNFGWVIGVDRAGHADDLRRSGADQVVTDLSELLEPAGGPA